ncbi:carboxymuconolactone decarboxylase family protein [Arthrobacter sp. StoSoilB13]|uniref:carboxymuconolactone decarboxylase family protein n=1 Tax=Arthrobacter sp. StoSoilB13 TaxID=2830993 RepID=UPI001CC486AD|nr:carboxymuconolactone decarboxylase family protein [Arthrobacter sp. StoSoilB13]BCW50154.1 hypothetical protein StoSoilB13_24960 [Arthrobacter sp. StoSoilB13]
MPEQETKARLAGYLDKQQPELYATLSHYAQQVVGEADRTGVPRRTIELLNYLASQINGCAFCLDLHHRRALGYGETEQRLSLVAVYKEVALFEPAERVAMEITEQITRMSTSRPSPELFERAPGTLQRRANQCSLHGRDWDQRLQPPVHPERAPRQDGQAEVLNLGGRLAS